MAASPDPLSLSTPEDSKSATDKRELTLSPVDNARLSNLRGPFDNHLRAIELGLGVEIRNRGEQFLILGSTADVDHVEQILRSLYETTKAGLITPEKIHLALRETQSGIKNQPTDHERQYPDDDAPIVIRTNRGIIKGRSPQQRLYLKAIQLNDLSFGIGPAGTGKTFLAVASAVQALEQDRVRRLVLVRPAVEAGEKLGFLPGDMAQKIDPYLRPLYDALYEMLGFEKVARLTERSVIEVAPLAFMRGRTLNDSFVILDEAQNTTMEQMISPKLTFQKIYEADFKMRCMSFPESPVSVLRISTMRMWLGIRWFRQLFVPTNALNKRFNTLSIQISNGQKSDHHHTAAYQP